jgi:FlaA1/EpsC-like NDP-sugar epimerase
LILSLKLVVFASFGLYSGVWRYADMRDLLAIFKAVTLSSVLSIAAMTMLFRFELFPRTVFLVDWMLLFLLVSGIRGLVLIIREYLFDLSDAKGKRVVIVGAGDAGDMVLRELRNNTRIGYLPVAFFDDDPEKQGRRIRGVPVLGGRDKIVELVGQLQIDQIMVAMPSAKGESLDGVVRICASTGLPVTVMPSIVELLQEGLNSGSLEAAAWKPKPERSEGARQQTWH